MKSTKTENIEMIKAVAEKLVPLIEKVAFLGGATTGLLITDPAAAEIRPTLDVDIIVEIISRTEYYKLEDTLRSLGFKQSMKKEDPICRWLTGNIKLDDKERVAYESHPVLNHLLLNNPKLPQ